VSYHLYEIRPRSDKRGVDLISAALPFGRLWYGEPNAVSNAIGYARFYSRSHDAVIRVYDDAGNVIETHEHKGDFNRSLYLLFGAASFGALDADRTSDRAGVVQEWQVRFKKHNSQDTSDRAFDNLGYRGLASAHRIPT
jgi:hypothetical protein